jgi:hypothetical protein
MEFKRKEVMTSDSSLYCAVRLTPTEAATAAAMWEPHGILGRLVRPDDEVTRVILARRAKLA